MWLAPDDPAVTGRMLAAHARACRALLAVPPRQTGDGATDTAGSPAGDKAGAVTWGWQGRSVGRAVTTAAGRRWLRVASGRPGELVATFWDGSVEAERRLPASLPKPRLLAWRDWADAGWCYRAELFEHADAAVLAGRGDLTAPAEPPSTWWAAVRRALRTLAAVPTERRTIEPGFLAWAMPHYLGVPASDHTAGPWFTAHGDFHWANLCGPQLRILDWEGWGLAPAGYDAAVLHAHSLTSSAAAATVRRQLAPLLDGAAGHSTELVVITDLLHAAEHGAESQLSELLRRRARQLLHPKGI